MISHVVCPTVRNAPYMKYKFLDEHLYKYVNLFDLSLETNLLVFLSFLLLFTKYYLHEYGCDTTFLLFYLGIEMH